MENDGAADDEAVYIHGIEASAQKDEAVSEVVENTPLVEAKDAAVDTSAPLLTDGTKRQSVPQEWCPCRSWLFFDPRVFSF